MKQLALILCLLLGAATPGAASAYYLTARLVAAAVADAGEAARQAAANSGGKVIDVQTSSKDGQPVYLVKVLLEDGRVKVVTIAGKPTTPDAR